MTLWNEIDHRPWGFYEVLSDKPDHKVKRITVYPAKRFSLQRHQKEANTGILFLVMPS